MKDEQAAYVKCCFCGEGVTCEHGVCNYCQVCKACEYVEREKQASNQEA